MKLYKVYMRKKCNIFIGRDNWKIKIYGNMKEKWYSIMLLSS